jgi:hypothetical protein
MLNMLATSEASAAVAIVTMSGGILVALVYVIAFNMRRVRENAYNARLKQMMIERGMSADEIERVINAQPRGTHNRGGP